MCGVYVIVCCPTGEEYVGGTRMSFASRFAAHLTALRRGSGPRLLQAAWDTYGEDGFDFIPLKTFPRDQVALREAELIREAHPALNVKRAPTGDVSSQLISYRKSIGWSGDDLYAAPHTLTRRKYDVGKGDMLTVHEIAARAGRTPDAISYRIRQGVRGRELISSRKTYQSRKIFCGLT